MRCFLGSLTLEAWQDYWLGFLRNPSGSCKFVRPTDLDLWTNTQTLLVSLMICWGLLRSFLVPFKKKGFEHEPESSCSLLDFDANFCFSLNFVEGSRFRAQISTGSPKAYFLLCAWLHFFVDVFRFAIKVAHRWCYSSKFG